MISDPDYSDKLSFMAEWFDFDAAYVKNFLLNYFPCDNTVELFDRDLNRIYLRRMACDTLDPKKIFVGNNVRIYGRSVKITDYADARTRAYVGKARQHTFALLKPSAVAKMGEIFDHIQDKQFEIVRIRMCSLTQSEAMEFYEAKKGDAFLPFVLDHVTSGPSVALELVGDDAIERWKATVGPTDPYEARRSAPDSFRALYGMEKASNGFHASDDCDAVMKAVGYFFPDDGKRKGPTSSALLKNSTCCVVKPHAVNDLGSIIRFIETKFKVTAMQTIYFTNADCDEFLEVYKTVVSNYNALRSSFLDGACVAMEISAKANDGSDVHGEFRKFVGPRDPDVARQIRPNTLRAKFGTDEHKNAVHCTDLAEDTSLELEYIFKILT